MHAIVQLSSVMVFTVLGTISNSLFRDRGVRRWQMAQQPSKEVLRRPVCHLLLRGQSSARQRCQGHFDPHTGQGDSPHRPAQKGARI